MGAAQLEAARRSLMKAAIRKTKPHSNPTRKNVALLTRQKVRGRLREEGGLPCRADGIFLLCCAGAALTEMPVYTQSTASRFPPPDSIFSFEIRTEAWQKRQHGARRKS